MRFVGSHADRKAMTYALRSQLRLCRFGTEFVGLDLDRNRYTLFRGDTAGRLGRLLDGSASAADTTWLLNARFIEEQIATVPHQPPFTPPVNSIGRRSRSISPHLTLEALAAHLAARRDVSRLALSRILDDLQQRMQVARPPDLTACAKVAAAFRISRRYLSQTDQCLACSTAMARMLAKRGLRVNLVIGVTLPFAAHCWVQAGATVLSDDIDRIRTYQPILTL